MKNHILRKHLINGALLGSSLLLLSACDWAKNKLGCQSCEHPSSKATGMASQAKGDGLVLATGQGKPIVTLDDHQKYWELILKANPNAEAMLMFMPGARAEVFKELVRNATTEAWIKNQKIDQDPAYQKEIDMHCRLAKQQVDNAKFQEYVISKVDTSDATAQTFYDSNRQSNQYFQNPPFVKTAGGVKTEAVQFTNEKQAKEFLDKAKAPGANLSTLAKEAKKSVNDFGGPVNEQTRNIDNTLKEKIMKIQAIPSFELIPAGKNFWVVHVISKQQQEYAPFNEVKDSVKQVMLQTKFPEVLAAEIEKLKKDFSIDDSAGTKYFEEEKSKKEAELQEQIQALKEQQSESIEDELPEAKAPVKANGKSQAKKDVEAAAKGKAAKAA